MEGAGFLSFQLVTITYAAAVRRIEIPTGAYKQAEKIKSYFSTFYLKASRGLEKYKAFIT